MNDLATILQWIIGLTIIIGNLAVLTLLFQRWRAGKPFVPFSPRQPVPWGFPHVALAFVFAVAVPASMATVMTAWQPPAAAEESTDSETPAKSMQPVQEMVLGGVFGIALCVAVWGVHLLTGATGRDLGWNPRYLKTDILTGIAAYLAVAIPVHGLTFLVGLVQDSDHPATHALRSAPLLVAVSAIGIAPLAEELLFRVLLQGWLETWVISAKKQFRLFCVLLRGWLAARILRDKKQFRTIEAETLPAQLDNGTPHSASDLVTGDEHYSDQPPRVIPLIVSAALFALAHWTYGLTAVPLFVFGLTLGYLYRQTHRILPSMVCHMTLNSVSMLIYFIQFYLA